MTVDEFLGRLKGVRRNGEGWTAKCPAHDDRNPSLSVSVGGDERILVHCHAGCSIEKIAAAAGASVRDLFAEPTRARKCVVATYDYLDEHGALLFQAVRYEPKGFRQRRPDGEGGWTWNLKGARRVLYRLPELRAAIEKGTTPVYVVEGEKDAHAIEKAGGVATTNPMGAGKWHDSYCAQLRGAGRVIVVADDDEPGIEHAQRVAASLAAAGVKASVVLPAVGKDVSDHLAAGKELDELRGHSGEATPESGAGPFRLDVMSACDLCALPDPDWSDELLGPLLVRGHRTIVGGHTGEGKTTFALAMVRAVLLETELLDWQGAGGTALAIDTEQGLRSIKRRLREAGLDATNRLDYVRVPDGLSLDRDPTHVAAVERVLDAKPYTVVVADPLYKLHAGDSSAEREAVDLMRLLDSWRARYGFALILPLHCRKPLPGVKFSIHDLFGSSAYVRGAEVVLGLQRVSDGHSRLHFLKDRDGDLPIGKAWRLSFDRDHGYRRDLDDEAERDVEAETLALLAGRDGEWFIAKEVARPKDKGGIGRNLDDVRAALETLHRAGDIEHAKGPSGRSSRADCYRLNRRTRSSEPVESVEDSGGQGERYGLTDSTLLEGRVRDGRTLPDENEAATNSDSESVTVDEAA